MENLRSFLFSNIITFVYKPFIYLLSIFILYEEFFIRINSAYRHNVLLAKYTKWKVFKVGFLNLQN
jgi:hypothetical protein